LQRPPESIKKAKPEQPKIDFAESVMSEHQRTKDFVEIEAEKKLAYQQKVLEIAKSMTE
jgi:hypothetical protein